jgi:flagellar motor switch protein FliN/FliY
MPDPLGPELDKLMEMLGLGAGAGAKPAAEPGAAPAPPAPAAPAPPVATPAAPAPPRPPATPAAPPAAQPFQFEPAARPAKPEGPAHASLEQLKDVALQVKIELGRTRMRIEDVLKLGPGSILEMDRLTGDPLDLYVNGVLVARGEVIVINENFALRITEILSPEERKA